MILTFLKRFCQNVNTFCTKHFCLPTFVPTYYFPCVTFSCVLFFSKIPLFTFLIHLELINYFLCVNLACILLFLQIDAQRLHIDEKSSTSSISIWPMMLLLGSTGKSRHWIVGACSRLRRRHGESEKLMTFWRGKNDRVWNFPCISLNIHDFAW